MHDDLEVHKFGGSCLRDGTDLERIANILTNTRQPVVVVVSALWGTTDRLMRAERLGHGSRGHARLQSPLGLG